MSGDSMGSKQRAWLCCGFAFFYDIDQDDAEVLCGAGQRPILMLPYGLTATQVELAFGWAFSDLCEQQHGWLGMFRGVMRLLGDAEAA